MGCFDTVWIPCPKCGTKYPAQSKGGACQLMEYELGNAPSDVLSNADRHAPFTCEQCQAVFTVALQVLAIPVLCTR